MGTNTRQTSTAQGSIASRQYDAVGNVAASSGTWTGPFGFVGGYGYQEDSDSGLQLLGHRYYDSSTGRFLTRDPIKDGRNWYGYCENNPLALVDPSGLVTLREVFLWFMLFISGEELPPKPGELPTTPPPVERPIGGRGGTGKGGSGKGGGASLGVILILIDGADTLYKGVKEVVLYRRKIQAYLDDIDGDSDSEGSGGGDWVGESGTGGPPPGDTGRGGGPTQGPVGAGPFNIVPSDARQIGGGGFFL